MLSRPFAIALTLLLCFSLTVVAQEEQKKTRRDQRKAGARKKDNDQRGSRQLMGQLQRFFAAANLTEEQTARMKELVDEQAEALAEIQKASAELMPPEKRKKRMAALREARQAGKKQKEAQAEAMKAAGISDEDQKKFLALNKKRNGIMAGIRDKVRSSLSEEQAAALGKGRKRGRNQDGGEGETKRKRKKDRQKKKKDKDKDGGN